jgi:hypothetical protein
MWTQAMNTAALVEKIRGDTRRQLGSLRRARAAHDFALARLVWAGLYLAREPGAQTRSARQ